MMSLNMLYSKKTLFSGLLVLVLLVGAIVVFRRSGVRQPSVSTPTAMPTFIGKVSGQWKYFPSYGGAESLLFDDGKVWISSGGLYAFDKATRQFTKTYTAPDGLLGARAPIKVGSKIYAGTEGGLVSLDLGSGKIEYLDPGDDFYLKSNINEIEYDGTSLWMTTFGGLRKLNLTDNTWTNYGKISSGSIARDGDLAVTSQGIYWISRANFGRTVWHLSKETNTLEKEFEAPGELSYLEGNDSYLAATVTTSSTAKSGTILVKKLSGGAWHSLPLSTGSQPQDYRKIALKGSTLYALAVDQKTYAIRMLEYDLERKRAFWYALDMPQGAAGDLGMGQIYPDPVDETVWIPTGEPAILIVDTKSSRVTRILDDKQYGISAVVAAREDELVVNSSAGAGMFNTQTKEFTLLSQQSATHALLGAKAVWLDVNSYGPGEGQLVLIHYDRITHQSKTIPLPTGKPGFIIPGQNADGDSILLATLEGITRLDRQGKLTSLVKRQIGTDRIFSDGSTNRVYFFEENKLKMVDVDARTETKLVSVPGAVAQPLFSYALRGQTLFVYSDAVYKVDLATGNATVIRQGNPNIPHTLALFKDKPAILNSERLSAYRPGADVGFGSAGFSFSEESILILNDDGTVHEKLSPFNGMMGSNVSQMIPAGDCLWFFASWGGQGVWGYCR